MENENYNDCFIQLVKQLSEKENADRQYIGMGNPNAKILFVGRERGHEEGMVKELGYATWWNKTTENPIYNKSDILKKFGGGSTLRKYQKLYESFCLETEKELYFESKVFNTDVNTNASIKTKNANTDGVQERKKDFFKHPFFQQFPIVVLACSNYFKPQEIYDTFGVSWKENNPHYCNEMKNRWWYAHYNDNETKLVIHTVQLSGSISDSFLQGIGKVIQSFLFRIDPKFRWNNGGKEIYAKIQEEPNFIKSDEYQNYIESLKLDTMESEK